MKRVGRLLAFAALALACAVPSFAQGEVPRATDAYLGALFPDHAPSKKVREPVHFGGPLPPAC